MKIVKLSSENVKRLTAVEITPDGHLITVGGKNGAGKSSVLDSIAYALGGEKLVPSQPIRSGETEAKIVIELDDLVVTRKFRRDASVCVCGHPISSHANSSLETEMAQQCQIQVDPIGNLCDCKQRRPVFGAVTSSLVVTNKDGARYPSPQAVLDKLLGKLTFDPLAFSRETSKKQDEILRKLVNLDFTLLDQQRKEAADRRTMAKKSLMIAQTRLGDMTLHHGVPTEETSVKEVTDAMARAEESRRAAQEAGRSVVDCQSSLERAQHLAQERRVLIQRLEHELELARNALKLDITHCEAMARNHDNAVETLKKLNDAVPDVTVLQKQLTDLEATNKKVRENAAWRRQEAELNRHQEAVTEEDRHIKELEAQKAVALARAQFPVPGLGLSDEGVTFEWLPLSEVASNVQLRVSVAIGLALNPSLKILLIRNGNLLDDENIKVVAEMAETAGAQVWMEYVTDSKDGVSVMMEDGHVQ